MTRKRSFRNFLHGSTALGGLLLLGSLPFPAHALEVIVDGSGDGTTGTWNSPWNVGGSLSVGHVSGDDVRLVIRNGGVVDSTFSNIGENSGSTGTVTVTGAGSTWANSISLYVGVSGSGTLNVEHGGSVVSDYFGYVGLGFGSSGAATVTGAGSTWVSGADLHVGRAGDGTLAISDGGMVSNVRGYVGYGPGSTGAVAVTGAGSSWANSSDLYVGYSGDGALTISDGGTVHVDGMMTIARDTGSTGTLNIGAAAGEFAAGAGILDAASLAFGAGAGTLVFNHTDTDYVFGTAISGGGTINHLAGNTTFSADSSGFTGETIVNGGTLTITGELGTTVTGGAEGEGAIIGHSAGSSGTVTVTGADANWSIAADLRVGFQGNGTLAISDGGTIYNRSGLIGIIPGSTGAVTVTGTGSGWDNSSDLFVGFFGNGALSISEGGYVTNGFGTIGLNYGSRGAVSVTGAGSVWKTNLELFVGYYGDGSLTISDGGTVDASNGTVTVARSSSTTGILNIGGAAGDAAAAAGTLNASSLVFGAGNGSLVFNHTDSDYDFGAAVSGSGTISHLAGMTTLSAESFGFTGSTKVSGGSLFVNGLLGGAIEVSGGMLGGSGTLGDLVVSSGGVLAPGNSIGILNAANATFNAGSSYLFELDDGGFGAGTNNDLINLTGTATINGGTVHVAPENGTDNGITYTPGTYTILTAAGGVTGIFDAVSDDYAFLSFALSYDANNAYLTSTSVTSFCMPGMSANQCAAGDGVFSVGSGSHFDAILAQSAAQAPTALDLSSGEIHASARTALVEDSRFVRETALERVRQTFAVTRANEDTGFWMHGFGGRSRIGGDGNAAALDRSAGGFFIGADGEASGNWRFGLLAGFSHSNFSASDRASSGSVDSYHLGAYGGTAWNDLALRFGGAYAWHDLSINRTVAFTGYTDSLSSGYRAGTGQLFGELAYGVDAGTARFEPFANLAWVSHRVGGFAEQGGAAALTGADDAVSATFTTLGVRLSTGLAMGEGTKARLTGMAGWRRAFGDTPTASLAFTGGTPFTVAGVPRAENMLVLVAGLDLEITPMATLGVNYSGQIGSGISDHAVKANFGVSF